jgi:hypothetical protein
MDKSDDTNLFHPYREVTLHEEVDLKLLHTTNQLDELMVFLLKLTQPKRLDCCQSISRAFLTIDVIKHDN